MILRRCLVILTAAILLGAVPGPAARADVAVLKLDGKGFGHGVGLSQWGAEYMARQGRSTNDIVATFYPGTSLGLRGGQVRVAVLTAANGVATVQFPWGGEVRSSPSGAQASGFPVKVGPGGRVRITFNGSYVVEPAVSGQAAGRAQVYNPSAQDQNCIPLVNCPTTTSTSTSTTSTTRPGGICLTCATTTTSPPTTPTTAGGATTTTQPGSPPPPPSSAPPPPPKSTSGSPVWAVPNGSSPTTVVERGRSYRGMIEATAGAGPLRLINQLDIETYLKGMGEVPSSWPAAAIGAQSIVARTYALRAMSFSGEICDYDLCQVYIGADRETAAQNAAVDATRGRVVTYGGQLASAVYSADAGGVSANTFEGFGTPEANYPYLTTVRYETDNPLPWHSDVALADVARRFGYPGSVTNVRITKAGPSGRALEVTIDGTSGAAVVDGRKFASRLGLRSTLFTPVIGMANAAPPPPADVGAIQALPEDASAITEAATLGESAFDKEATAKNDGSADKAIAALLATDFLPDGSTLEASTAALLAGILVAAGTAVACGQTRRQSLALTPGVPRLF